MIFYIQLIVNSINRHIKCLFFIIILIGDNMKIYIDLIFLINVFFDFILLLSTSLILRRNVKIYRIILGSLVGGLSIFFLFFKISNIAFFFIKIIIAILMCLVSFSYKDFIYTLKNIIYLYIVSIVLGGFLYFLNIEFSYKNEGIIFYHNGFSINIFIIIIITPILMYLYVKEMKELKNNYSKYYDVCICFKSNKIVNLKGFFDTGNNLVDPYKNRPILIVYEDIINKYVDKSKILLVPYNNISNKSIMECIIVKKVIVNNIEFKNILIGLSKEKIYIDGVDCILNNNMEGIC